MPTSSVIDFIDRMIQKHTMLTHPFYIEWGAGTLSLATLQEYARQNYRHTEAFPRYISGIHSHCEDLTIRQELLENLIEEERGEENHPELWLRFTDALGLARQDVMHTTPLPATTRLVETMVRLTQSSSVAAGLASLYAYEAQIPEVAGLELEGLRKFYGITDEDALTFFTVHMQADLVHRQVGRDILTQIITDDESADVLDAVNMTLAALNGLLSEIMGTK